jgi:hypothetical protein
MPDKDHNYIRKENTKQAPARNFGKMRHVGEVAAKNGQAELVARPLRGLIVLNKKNFISIFLNQILKDT